MAVHSGELGKKFGVMDPSPVGKARPGEGGGVGVGGLGDGSIGEQVPEQSFDQDQPSQEPSEWWQFAAAPPETELSPLTYPSGHHSQPSDSPTYLQQPVPSCLPH